MAKKLMFTSCSLSSGGRFSPLRGDRSKRSGLLRRRVRKAGPQPCCAQGGNGTTPSQARDAWKRNLDEMAGEPRRAGGLTP